ncbi:MAG: hypothetical protein JNM41_12565 [Flavipsychrobacter sp.]|nr:hypothetical protein [Flavipsychrobacter sp.]
MLRIVFSLIGLLLLAAEAPAKDNFVISPPTLLSENGINKVLCMKNGHTLLFHFEINKPLTVIVYDSSHNRVANRTVASDLLDAILLPTSSFKGLYEVNGEAVLFMEQQRMGRHTLIRLRFNARTGQLVAEDRVGRSHGIAKPMRFFVLKNRAEEGYAVLFAEDVPQFRKCSIQLVYYNKRHDEYKRMELDPGRKNYDFLTVTGAEALPQGICVSLGLSVMLVNGTGSLTESAARYNHYLQVFYIPNGGAKPIIRKADLSTEIYPYYTTCSYNPFAGSINVLLLSYREAFYRYGVEMRPTAFVSNLLFRLDEHDLTGNYSWFRNELANSLLIEKTDTASSFAGLPLCMFTNSNGLSTVVSESYERYMSAENYTRSRAFETYLGSICITQVDDTGKEIWGTVLPRSQYYRSYRHYYRPTYLAKRWQDHAMFNDLPPQITERQFLSAAVYARGDNHYIIYNDCGKNIRNTITSPGDTLYASELANACYYRMDRKRQITKEYLLGEPLDKEYKSCYVEGGDFDEQRGVYASLIRYKRGSYISLRMAWVTLD